MIHDLELTYIWLALLGVGGVAGAGLAHLIDARYMRRRFWR